MLENFTAFWCKLDGNILCGFILCLRCAFGIIWEVYFGTGCAHLRPGAVRRMSPGRSSTDEPWAQFDWWALGAVWTLSLGRNLTDEPAIFSTIGHSEMVSSNDSHVWLVGKIDANPWLSWYNMVNNALNIPFHPYSKRSLHYMTLIKLTSSTWW